MLFRSVLRGADLPALLERVRETYGQHAAGTIVGQAGNALAFPNAEIMVVRPDGSCAGVNEPGELVHRGSFISRGYWRRPEATAEKIRSIGHFEDRFDTKTLDITYPADWGREGVEAKLASLCAETVDAIKTGHNILIISDRAMDRDNVAIPALLALSAIHQHLVREGLRTTVGLVVETACAREVNHFAVLAGYGAEAVHPYLAMETLVEMHKSGELKKKIEQSKMPKDVEEKAQQEFAACLPGVEPVMQGDVDIADVQPSRRRRGEAGAAGGMRYSLPARREGKPA